MASRIERLLYALLVPSPCYISSSHCFPSLFIDWSREMKKYNSSQVGMMTWARISIEDEGHSSKVREAISKLVPCRRFSTTTSGISN